MTEREAIVRLAGGVWMGWDMARDGDTYCEWTRDAETGVITILDCYQNPRGDHLSKPEQD